MSYARHVHRGEGLDGAAPDLRQPDRRSRRLRHPLRGRSDRLVRICAGFVGADAAEDVVHDAYLRGRARIDQLRDEDLLEPWMTRIAINLCMNRHRSRRTLRDLLPRLRSREGSPERDLGLLDLVERLPPRERTVLVLHYAYGYQLEEIGRMSELSAVNVRTIVFRARRRLADQLREADR